MNSPTTDALKRTPLYAWHKAAGANLVPFGGWEMPLQYGPQIKEHLATRTGCGIFDVSHMGQIIVEGRDAAKLVSRLVTRDATRIEVGKVKYSLLLNEQGGIVDDLMTGRLEFEKFLLVVNASTYEGDVAWMRELAARGSLDAELVPCAERFAMIAVQGPRWREVAEQALGLDGDYFAEYTPMTIQEVESQYGMVIISNTGYTGEAGFELMLPPEQATAAWQALVDSGATPVGLAARDSLRMEKGMPLSGQDFTEANNPFEAGLAWGVDLPGEYAGAAALEQIKTKGVGRRFVGFAPQGKRIARHGAAVLKDGVVVGAVTSGGFSPCMERPMALGYIAAELSVAGTEVELDLGRDTRVGAVVTGRRHVK